MKREGNEVDIWQELISRRREELWMLFNLTGCERMLITQYWYGDMPNITDLLPEEFSAITSNGKRN